MLLLDLEIRTTCYCTYIVYTCLFMLYYVYNKYLLGGPKYGVPKK